MSRVLDDRIVEMQFDNAQFEKNVSTSIGTIERLKKSLDFSGVVDSFSGITKTANDFDISTISNGLGEVGSKFTVFEGIALGALTRIGSKVTDLGIQLVKSLSVDQISAGWSKFGSKTTSVATLVAQGYALEEVNTQLDRLNWFTDETSYNFVDMVSNIAKFTATGKDLNESVTAMEGIANWAALSGQNAVVASRAMFQLSQAMGAGVMRKEDYKSIQNASMDTEEFRQKALDAAVALGTLRKNADGTYESLVATGKAGAEAFSISQFAEKLTEGAWFTSDVMMAVFQSYSAAVDQIYDYADEKGITASQAIEELGDSVDQFGLKAFKAAQEARTWGDAVDSVKDAVSTGWMSTFEIIFGNQKEATKLWTDLANAMYEAFASGAEGRNELLTQWKKFSGRDQAITAFWNLWEAGSKTLDAVKTAFRDIFPKATVTDLLRITANIRRFTESLIISDETSAKLTRSLRGVFAIIDILRKGVSALIKAGADVLKTISPIGDGLLDLSGSFSDYLVSLDDAISKGKMFETIFGGVANAIKFVVNIVRSGISDIGYIFSEFQLPDINLGKRIEDFFSDFPDLLEGIRTRIDPVINYLTEVGDKISEPFLKAKDRLIDIGKDIVDTISNIDFKTGVDIFTSGLFAALVLNLRNFSKKSLSEILGIETDFKGLKDFFNKFGKNLLTGSKNFSDIGKSISGIFSSTQKAINGWTNAINAKALLTISGALAILTVALIGLSILDMASLTRALIGITVLFQVFFKSLNKFSSIFASGGIKGLFSVNVLLISLSVSMVILANAVKKLSDLSWDGMIKGLGGVSVLLFAFTKATKSLAGQTGSMIKGAGGLIAFAIAIRILSSAVSDLGSLDLASLAKGIGGIIGLLGSLVIAFKLGNFSSIGIKTGLGILALAGALKILASAVSDLGSLDILTLGKGIGAIFGLLAELAGFTVLAGSSKHILSTGVSMILLGAAIKIFASAIKDLGAMNTDDVILGLVALGGALAAVTLAVNLMPAKIALIAPSLLLISAAISGIASTLTSFSGMSWEEVGKSLVMLAGSLTILAVATTAMSGSLVGAAAITILSIAVSALAGALTLLGKMSISQMIIAFVSLGGALAILGGASVILAPIIPVMLALAGAMLIFGAGVAALGIGVSALSAGLLTIVGTGAAGILAIEQVLEAIVGFIPKAIEAVGLGLIALAKVIGDAAPELAKAAFKCVVAILEEIKENVPKILQLVIDILVEIGKTIVQNLAPIAKAGWEIVQKLANSISEKFGLLVNAAKESVVTFIRSMRNSVSTKYREFLDIGTNVINGFVEGIKNGIGKVRDAVAGVANAAVDKFKSVLGIHSPSKETEWIAEQTDAGFAIGLRKKLGEILSAVKYVSDSTLDSFSSNQNGWDAIGENIISSLVSGVISNADSVISSVTTVAEASAIAAKNALSGQEIAITPVLDTSLIDSGINGISRYSGVSGIRTPSSIVRKDFGSPDQISPITLASSDKITHDEMVSAFEEALSHMGVYLDKSKVGRLTTDAQRNASRQLGN